MPGHDIIVVGASAGGVEALGQLVCDLPPDLPAAIFVVLHVSPQGTSVLPKILNRYIQKRNRESSLRACHPQDGEAIQYGRIYVAPPDRHLLVKDGYVNVARGPKENSHRPAVDPLFRTAAREYGPRVVGVVLSGNLDDGTAGLVAVKKRGGVAIVQNPDEALYSGMPRSAIENVDVDHILSVSEIVPVLVELAHKPVEEEGVQAVSSEMEMESDMAELKLEAMQSSDRPGTPSPFSCPECSGTLWELEEGKLIRFRCRTGHALSVKTLLAKQTEAVEDAMWVALRALEEKAALAQRLASRARERNQSVTVKHFEEQEQSSKQPAAVIRQMLLQGNGSNAEVSRFNGHLVGKLNRAGGAEGAEGEVLKDSLSFHSPPASPAPPALFVVAIAVSAEQVNALSEVLSALTSDFPAAITVVQQLHPQNPSELAEILNRRTSLIVKPAESGDSLRPGTIYIGSTDKHLLVNPDSTLSLTHSELVHFARPSVDLLFESVAASFKQRAIAVLLTGTGSDGVMGVRAIKEMGGTAIAQVQATSEDFDMPTAIDTGVIDWVLPLNEIAAALVDRVKTKERESQNT